MNRSIKSPSQGRAINTRNAIIEVAKKLFHKNGYKKTNTIIIAKEAKVSVGIVYSYFNDKKELFEIWLNELLSKSDDYFYNQFRLKEYDVELSLIIKNILEKVSDEFFSSPIVYEKNIPYVNKTLSIFFNKMENLFVKACNDTGVFIKNSEEVTHIILNLIYDYNNDLKNYKGNKEILKNKYIQIICSLIND